MPMSERVDVAVVGASTAGLMAAWQLARAGRRVAVFEQNRAIDPARRTYIITPYFLSLMPFPVEEAILHRTPVMALASPGASSEVRLANPDLIVERNALTRLMARQAQDAGVHLHMGHRLIGLAPTAAGARLEFQLRDNTHNRVVEATAVIGADGVLSDVARLAGIPRPTTVVIMQAEVALPRGWDPGRVQVWFERNETRFFYWLIPESDRRAVVGLVADDPAAVRPLLVNFLQRLQLCPLAFQGARVAMHHPRLRPWTRVGNAPVFLVGDAAGQVKVTTVGGTVTGLWGALAAAEALVRDVPYAQTVRAVKRELDLHWLVRALLDRLDNAGYDALLRALTPRVRAFLAQRTRDEMAGAFWCMVLRSPRLWMAGLRTLRLRPPAVHSPVGQQHSVPEVDLRETL